MNKIKLKGDLTMLRQDIKQKLQNENYFLQDEDISSQDLEGIVETLGDKEVPSIDLASNYIGDVAALTLMQLSTRNLGLAKTNLTDETVHQLLACNKYSSLNLRGNKITDSAFSELDVESLTSITQLDLSYTYISDATLNFLVKFPNLKIVLLNFNQSLSSNAVIKLAGKLSLCYIESFGCQLNDKTREIMGRFNVSNKDRTTKFLKKKSISCLY